MLSPCILYDRALCKGKAAREDTPMTNMTAYLQGLNGTECGSHIPDSYQGVALYEGLKAGYELGCAESAQHILAHRDRYGDDFLQAAVFPVIPAKRNLFACLRND